MTIEGRAKALPEQYAMNGLRGGDDEDDEETGLTQDEREYNSQTKSRNTDLDRRIVPSDGVNTMEVEKSLVQASLVRNSLVNALLIGLWYSFSISISIYNKWMFSKENLDFHFPLFTTSLHMIVQFLLATLALYLFPQFRPKPAADRLGEYHVVNDADEGNAAPPPQKSLMTRWFYLTRIGPCGTATALDIGLGNFSLRFISLTFYTMCKSSVLAFVLVFAFLFRLEKPTWRLCLIILLMTGGVLMMVAGETAFSVIGFLLVMSASLCSGFRWSLTQILLLRNPATSNPFSSIFFLTPVMFAALFLLAIPIEGIPKVIEGMHDLAQQKGALLSIAILLFPGTLAFLMVAAEFALLLRTSVVTLSVCGIFKEVLTISAAGVVFGDELSPINISGLVVTILSIAAYNCLKYSNMRQEALKKAHELTEDNFSGRSTSMAPARDTSEVHGSYRASEDLDADANDTKASSAPPRHRDPGSSHAHVT